MSHHRNFFEYLFEFSKTMDKKAIIEGNQTFSYDYLYNNVKNLALYIKHNFDTNQKYFLLCSDNSNFFIVCYFAIIAAGRIVIPLHPQTSNETINFICSNLNIETVFVQKRYINKFVNFKSINKFIVNEHPSNEYANLHIELYNKSFNFTDENELLTDELSSVAVLIFTSGSTGTPKGVMLSQKNLLANTESIISYLNLNNSDIMMEVLPYSYCYGASWLHTMTRVGGTNVINNKFMLINRVLQEINSNYCTGFGGVPSHFQMLLRNSKIKEMTFPSLRFVAQAGGKLANVFIEELIQALPSTKIYIMYGQTEATARLSYLPPELLKIKLGSIGKGIPGVTLDVLNKKGQPVKKGEVGTIVASGDNVMVGYWNDPEETSKTIINGKLWTGDLATVDEDGFIYVVDREKHFIKSGGHRISPKEIEDHIAKLTYVIECAVIGVFDDMLGEAPKAYVVIKNYKKESEDEYKQEIQTHCRKELASFKVPKYIEFIKALPKNTSNKVLVNELKKLNQYP